MFALLGDLASSIVARHPRLRLAAEALEDAAHDVAEELGPRAVVAVDTVANVVDATARGVRHLVALDTWIDTIVDHTSRLAVLEATHHLTTRRLAQLDRRVRELEAACDREAR